MGSDAWITLGTIGVMVAVMVAGLAGPDLVLVAGLTTLLVGGVLEPDQALSGFANPAVASIGALFVVAAAVRETGALDYVAQRVLGRPTTIAGAQLRVMAPVGVLSAFMNNTPVVAMFVPLVQRWSKQIHQPVAHLLMPLSYAAILGGMCTLIGTSTNLLVAGMYGERTGQSLGMFEMTPLGLPVLAVGVLYMVVMSPRLLKEKAGASDLLGDAKEYAIAFRVEAGSPVVGQTIESSLRSLPKLFLFELERDGELFPAVKPTTRLRVGDLLVFAGIVVDAAVDLRKMGLVPAADQLAKLSDRSARSWFEAVVGQVGPLVGRTVRESRFRTEYNAAIIAVRRHGERVSSKVGDIVLEPGDVLLIEGGPAFARRHRNDPAFVLVSGVADSATPKREKAGVAALVLLAMVASNALGLLDLLSASLLGAGAMLLLRCIDGAKARRALDLRVLVTVGAAIGIGVAVQRSGLAATAGGGLVSLLAGYGSAALMAGLFAATAIIAGFVYTATAAALMFPVAAAAAEGAGLPLLPMALLVMVAACSAFSTPIGYAANLMVYGPGGYRFRDFMRVGLPLQVLVGLVTVAMLQLFWLS